MPAERDFDIIIIGTGAGGGTLLHELAPSGKRILVLERGDLLPREQENWEPEAVFEQKRYLAPETWYDRDDRPFRPYTHYWVGGNTKMYGAALLRMRESDFGPVRHFGGVSPAWPLSYADFEPYYTRAERLYSVRGRRGSDPCEPPASAPYLHPPLEPEPRIAELYADLRSLGLKPFPIPLGLRADSPDAADAPRHPARFDGYPDPTEAKADAHVVCIKPALARANVTLLTRALVERLETDPSGRVVSKVHVHRDSERLTFRGDVVVLACGAINSAALLLRSATERHPRGLGNSSGLVGRNYMCHQNGCLIMVSRDPNPSRFQKHFGLTDFYQGDGSGGPPLGLIQLMGKPDRSTLEWLRAGALPGVPIEDIQRRTVDFFLTAEDLPDEGNRVTIRDDGSIRLSYTPNNTEAYRRLEARCVHLLTRVEEMRGRLRPTFLSARLGIDGVSHQCGTLRFGADPSASVLNLEGRAHDLDNLYAADGSFFPSSAAVNPALTIMANAMRVAERIRERLCSPCLVMAGGGGK